MIDTDWKNRTLCSDGSCIGIIGDDGYCKECGKPLDPADPERPAPESDETGEMEAFFDEPAAAAQDSGEVEPAADWQNRQLCIDGSCIGVLGTDGRCKECGKPAKNAG
ncbi:MAG: hypothetical protein H8D81_01420 [Deltaproteobacteria bacterium]|nr:hypothetical protein [Deltaproteobacteria bacterium]